MTLIGLVEIFFAGIGIDATVIVLALILLFLIEYFEKHNKHDD